MPLGSPRRRNWLPFHEARAFARSLRLRSGAEWRRWSTTPARPWNVPSNPNLVYPEWSGWSDWVGVRGWRPFEDARAFARSLGLKSLVEWLAWSRTPVRPQDIPTAPNEVYRGQWSGWYDWLGTRRRGHWRPYSDARAYVRSLPPWHTPALAPMVHDGPPRRHSRRAAEGVSR
jgi:hypothetical protein